MRPAAMTLCTIVSPPVLSCSSFRPLRMRIADFRTPLLVSRITFIGDDRKNRHSMSIPRIDARLLPLHQNFISSTTAAAGGGGGGGSVFELNDGFRKLLQVNLWIAEAVYILWLFLLPYAPGGSCLGHQFRHNQLSDRPFFLNFFFILPLTNSAFLIPYMAIRLNKAEEEYTPRSTSQLGSIMTSSEAEHPLLDSVVELCVCCR